jgi:hypothetical protein
MQKRPLTKLSIFSCKNPEETKDRKIIPHHKEGLCDGLRASTIQNKLKRSCPVKSGVSPERPLSPLLLNIVPGFLARAIRQEKERKVRKGRSQVVPLFCIINICKCYVLVLPCCRMVSRVLVFTVRELAHEAAEC